MREFKIGDKDLLAPQIPRWRAGLWHTAPGARNNITYAWPLGRLVTYPLLVPQDCAITGMALDVTTSGAGASLRLGAYTDDEGQPGELMFDAGVVSGDTTGIKELVTAQTLPAGFVWLAMLTEGTEVAGVRFMTPNLPVSTDVSLALYGTSQVVGYYENAVPLGALPAVMAGRTAATAVPIIAIRAG